MAINPTVIVVNTATRYVPLTALMAPWVQVGDDDYLRKLDASLITDPNSQIIEASRQIFSRGNRPGGWLALRMRYSSGFTITQTPIARVFGRVDAISEWQALVSVRGELGIEFVPAASDLESGGPKLTTVSLTDHVLDTQGCEQFLVGVQARLEVSSGTPSKACLEVRFS